ncbi:hypothetical protein CWM47_22405 [Spirosoma pollinicola]|uniref:Outer membrane protein beta-barrel domain-containing protein n=1 Tax=Spirosoma pollinicola TaxID=2057025 RepID=A0A2K8Z3C9_9BACT|nr:hypothetical protein CWM47_22405 [Spirosoma pollinicola]
MHAGTAGIGVDISKSIFRQLSIRAGANLFTYNGNLKSGKDSDDLQIGFDYTVKLSSFNLLLDYYPIKRAGFRLTAGAYYNQNQISFFGKPTKDVKFNDVVFTVDQVGTVDGKANFSKVAPYAGIGWGHPFLKNRLKFMVDVGVFYQQSPTITFATTGMLEPSSDQGPIIQDNLKPLKYYPVVNLGISYNLVSTRF